MNASIFLCPGSKYAHGLNNCLDNGMLSTLQTLCSPFQEPSRTGKNFEVNLISLISEQEGISESRIIEVNPAMDVVEQEKQQKRLNVSIDDGKICVRYLWPSDNYNEFFTVKVVVHQEKRESLHKVCRCWYLCMCGVAVCSFCPVIIHRHSIA